MSQAVVRNAADPEQVQYGGRKEQRRAGTRLALLAEQLKTAVGRRFVWEELERHQLFHRVTLWQQEAVYEFLGRRESGLDLWWEVHEAFPEALIQMQQEAHARATRDRREQDAVHTPASGTEM